MKGVLVAVTAALVVAAVLFLVMKSEETPRTGPPATPTVEQAQVLLKEIVQLERLFGLAIITATPPKTKGLLLSKRDTEKRIREIHREREFLEYLKPAARYITQAMKSLRAFTKSGDDRDWREAWRHLEAMRSEISDVTMSSLWGDYVPPNESLKMIEQFDQVEREITLLVFRL